MFFLFLFRAKVSNISVFPRVFEFLGASCKVMIEFKIDIFPGSEVFIYNFQWHKLKQPQKIVWFASYVQVSSSYWIWQMRFKYIHLVNFFVHIFFTKNIYPQDFEILGCPARPVLPHGEKMPL